jgi:hypothetical protein
MHGITERYLSGQKADAAGFVRKLLDDLESRISVQFSRVSSLVEPKLLGVTIHYGLIFCPLLVQIFISSLFSVY